MKKLDIVVHYHYIALYRVPVFTELVKSENFSYVFWASRGSKDSFLKTVFYDSGLPIEEVPLRTFKLPFKRKEISFQMSAIAKLIRKPPDVYVVLASANSISTWLSINIARIMGCVVLTWTHGFLKDEKGIKGFLRTIFYRMAHGHMLYGNKAKGIMIKKGFDPAKLDVVYNSLDYEKQKKLRDNLGMRERIDTRHRLGIADNAFVLIAIGRLLPKLKIKQVIDGVKRLNDRAGNICLIVVGDGPEKEDLAQQVKSLDINDKVVFCGAIYDEEKLSKIYNASDVAVVMGKVGLSAMHALGYGVPLITNDSMDEHFPEIEAVREGVTGWFFKEDDINDFVNKITQIRDGVGYRGEYYRNCIKVIEDDYTPARQVELIESAIAKHVGDGKRYG